jgi:glycosyltransferase involved in cell wall biosynthesis
MGFQSPEEYYSDSSIFCLTSNFEGFPMVLPEAMAFGVVPFAFDSFPAVHDIIEDGKTGVLVKPFSIKEYADKLAQLMDDGKERARMSENCMKYVTRFSLDNIVNQWVTLINSLQE